MTISQEDLQERVLAHIRNSERRQTSATVTATLCRDKALTQRRLRAAIRSLVNGQHLIYTYEMGCSFLIENTQRCWQPTPHIWILPPKCSLPQIPASDAIVVRLAAGAAFGSGEHPTTILCLQALEHLYCHDPERTSLMGAGIDIGTGSGILAMVAARMGGRSVLALDTDPCAREETRTNLSLNHLSHLVDVGAAPFEDISRSFDLIIANLRYPTLLKMLPWAREHLREEGRMVISGCLVEEMPRLKARFKAVGLQMCWSASRKRWAAGVFGLRRP